MHPIELLIQRSSGDYFAMLNRQSSTLEAAETEYRNRYRRSPPPGFDKWFDFAKARQSPLIDNLNIISKNLEPFWRLSPAQIRANINQVKSTDTRL